MKQIERILAPTDFSEASAQALDRAVALAVRAQARVRVLNVDLLHEHDPARTKERSEGALERMRGVWERISSKGDEVRLEFVSARAVAPFDGIRGAIEDYEPDMVVMGTHGGSLLMGSTGERVVRHAPCNVLVSRKGAHGNWPEEPGRILVPVDFSENSSRAYGVARELAQDGSKLTLVHVVDNPGHPPLYADAVPSPFAADPGLQESLERRLADWAAGPVDQLIVTEGEVKRTLLDVAIQSDADLVVIGTRGSHTFPETLIGSTAERLTRSCVAPVLTIR